MYARWCGDTLRRMALMDCKDCGTQVSSEAKACLACGRPIKRGVSAARLIVTTIILIGLLLFLAGELPLLLR